MQPQGEVGFQIRLVSKVTGRSFHIGGIADNQLVCRGDGEGCRNHIALAEVGHRVGHHFAFPANGRCRRSAIATLRIASARYRETGKPGGKGCVYFILAEEFLRSLRIVGGFANHDGCRFVDRKGCRHGAALAHVTITISHQGRAAGTEDGSHRRAVGCRGCTATADSEFRKPHGESCIQSRLIPVFAGRNVHISRLADHQFRSGQVDGVQDGTLVGALIHHRVGTGDLSRATSGDDIVVSHLKEVGGGTVVTDREAHGFQFGNGRYCRRHCGHRAAGHGGFRESA